MECLINIIDKRPVITDAPPAEEKEPKERGHLVVFMVPFEGVHIPPITYEYEDPKFFEDEDPNETALISS
jgi:hypothetical protein